MEYFFEYDYILQDLKGSLLLYTKTYFWGETQYAPAG